MHSPQPPSRTPRVSRNSTGLVLALTAAALFSLKPILVKLVYQHEVGPVTLLALRMAMSLPFYLTLGVMAWRKRPRDEPLRSRGLLAMAGIGLLGYYLASMLDLAGLQIVPAQLERTILFTYPLMVAVLAHLFFGARHGASTWMALGCAYLGVVVLFATDLQHLGSGLWKGTGLVLASALAFALYTLLGKPWIDRVGSTLFTCLAMGAASLGIFGQFLATEVPSALVTVPLPALGWILVISIACTVVPSLLYAEAVRRIGPTHAAITGAIGPVCSGLLAVWVLGEVFGIGHAFGTGLAITGVLWLGKAQRKAA